MSKPLFISNIDEFTQRISQEASSQAIIANSLLRGAEIIADPSTQLKAIYLNPNDSSFSALKLLELSILHRPATPIFMIDSKVEMSREIHQVFFEQHHIQGFFNGTESFQVYESMFNAHRMPTVSKITSRKHKNSTHPGFIAVPILDFIHSHHYRFDVFLEGGGKLNLFASSGSTVEPEYLSNAMEQAEWFYVPEANVREIRKKIHKTQQEMVFSSSFPMSWKTAETLYKAKSLLAALRSESLSDTIVNRSHELLEEVFHLVSQLQSQPSAEKLNQFIDQTKECDRFIACATLAILMCKSLKFEKNAIVEILGLASFFQDISLFNTPFGNLMDVDPNQMSAETKLYYLKHPTISADILAQTTSMPDVTLQVIRQQHERKDRTGFPSKIGGMQLHPMAEILSLINEFIIQNPLSLVDENEIYRHYSDKVVVAFNQIHLKKGPSNASISTKVRSAA